jgi:hypothetical protein
MFWHWCSVKGTALMACIYAIESGFMKDEFTQRLVLDARMAACAVTQDSDQRLQPFRHRNGAIDCHGTLDTFAQHRLVGA